MNPHYDIPNLKLTDDYLTGYEAQWYENVR